MSKQPAPTALHAEFVRASQQAEYERRAQQERLQRRANVVTRVLITLMVGAVMLSLFILGAYSIFMTFTLYSIGSDELGTAANVAQLRLDVGDLSSTANAGWLRAVQGAFPKTRLYLYAYQDGASVYLTGVMDGAPLAAPPRPLPDWAYQTQSGQMWWDEYGRWVSHYEVLRDTAGQIVGLLVVDIGREGYLAMPGQIADVLVTALTWVAAAGGGVAFILGYIVMRRRLTRPPAA